VQAGFARDPDKPRTESLDLPSNVKATGAGAEFSLGAATYGVCPTTATPELKRFEGCGIFPPHPYFTSLRGHDSSPRAL
jgi:hypothetical protein